MHHQDARRAASHCSEQARDAEHDAGQQRWRRVARRDAEQQIPHEPANSKAAEKPHSDTGAENARMLGNSVESLRCGASCWFPAIASAVSVLALPLARISHRRCGKSRFFWHKHICHNMFQPERKRLLL
jgi:hypothetical protein